MKQEKVWETIAPVWNEYRNKPSPEVEDFLKGKKGKVVDWGCGSGRNFLSFPKGLKVYAVDFSKEMLKFAEEKAKSFGLEIETFHSSSNEIPLEDNFCDGGICIAVLHCVPTEKARQKVIDELYRVLKPGSEALVMVWSKNSPRLKGKPKETFIPWTSAGVEKRYTYVYDKDEIEMEVKKAGFEIVSSGEDRNISLVIRKGV
ncbi:class I SAM-dependent methyltransferase [Candidatus Pacearchaeota archaeon]|nr:class I SAM-dependent methyltransferase [Candidatus Pacearchaeota archaeon]